MDGEVGQEGEGRRSKEEESQLDITVWGSRTHHGGLFCFTMCKIGSDLFCKRGKSGKKWFKGKPNLQWEKFSIDCTEALLDSTSAHFAPNFGFGWNWFGQNYVSNITFNQHHHRLFQISTPGLAFTDTLWFVLAISIVFIDTLWTNGAVNSQAFLSEMASRDWVTREYRTREKTISETRFLGPARSPSCDGLRVSCPLHICPIGFDASNGH